MTKIVAISDMHGRLPDEMPEGDLLLIGGDVCPSYNHARDFQAMWLRHDFKHWLESLEDHYTAIIGVGGNHDFVLEESKIGWELPWTYLDDVSVTVLGLKIYGSPMSNKFGNWAFMAEDDELDSAYWSGIPLDTDILITHGPAYGVGDEVLPRWVRPGEDRHVGSPSLKKHISKLSNLKLHVFGHIHEGRGVFHRGTERRYIAANVSHIDPTYTFGRGPEVFDV